MCSFNKTLYLTIFIILLTGCKNFGFVAPVREYTECDFKLNGVDPKNTLLVLSNDIKVESNDDSRYTILPKGTYYPAMHWKKCQWVSYAAPIDLNIAATNKFSNFFEKGEDIGGVQLEIENPEKIHIVWYYRKGSGFLSFVPKQPDLVNFKIIYLE